MNSEATYEKLVQLLRGRAVVRTRIVLATLQVYFAPDDRREQGHPHAPELWCEPTWHLRGSPGVITGSGAILSPTTFSDDEEIADADATIAAASAASKVLIGCTLEQVTLDAATCAITAEFSSGLFIATFFDAPDIDRLWLLRSPDQKLTVRATSHGLALGSRARDA